MGEDGSIVMVGNAGGSPHNSAAIKFDEDGSVLWEWQVIFQILIIIAI